MICKVNNEPVGIYNCEAPPLAYTLDVLQKMNNQEIENLFWNCFDSLPEEDRESIKKYWADSKIEIKITSSPLNTLGDVCGEKLNKFTFRAFAINWPKSYVETLIKHELAHVWLFSQEMFLRQPKLSQSSDSKKNAESLVSEVKNQYDLNERLARRTNEIRWNSDEEGLDSYWNNYLRKMGLR